MEAHTTGLLTREGSLVTLDNTGGEEEVSSKEKLSLFYAALINTHTTKVHLVLVAGQPIGEQIVQHGPFVMNTEAEIRQAIRDFQTASNGFERAKSWRSVEGNK